MSSSAIPAKFISLVPTNGNQFDGGQGKKIIFELEPSLGYVKGRDSYLVLKVLNNDTSERQRVMFNNLAGVSSIMSRVDIYSLKTGQHLETLENYNKWCAIENQYFYDDKTNIQSLQGVGSEAYANDVDSAGKCEPTAPLASSPNDSVLSPVDSSGRAVYNYRVFTTPLKAGIFRWWDDERLCPVLNLLGLRIEITLEDPKVALLNMAAHLKDGSTHAIGSTAAATLSVGNTTAGDTTIDTNGAGFNNPVRDCGFSVGNVINIHGDVGGTPTTEQATITAIAAAGDQVRLTMAALTNTMTAVTIRLSNDLRAYKVEPEFRVLQVAPPNANISGIDYEFTTYDLYFDTLFSSQRKHQIDIPSVQTKALAIMTQFDDPATSQLTTYSSYFTGELPSVVDGTGTLKGMNMDSVQYFINGRLQPVRAYDPRTQREKIISEHELVKALTTINKEPEDLGQSDQHNLNNYTNTYLIARELARGNYFYDLSDAEPQIRLGFSATRTSNLTCNTFVWSKRVVVADPAQGLRVIL